MASLQPPCWAVAAQDNIPDHTTRLGAEATRGVISTAGRPRITRQPSLGANTKRSPGCSARSL